MVNIPYSGLSSGPSPYPNTGPSARSPMVPNYSDPWFGTVGTQGGPAGLGGRAGFTPTQPANQFYQQYGTMGLANQLMAPIDAAYNQLYSQYQLQGALNTDQYNLATQELRQKYAHDLAAQNIQAGDIAARRTRLGQQPGFINREYGLDVQAANLGKKEAGAEFQTNLRHLYSDAAARGATVTAGTFSARQDLWDQFMRSMEAGDISIGRAGLAKDVSFADLAQANSRLDAEAQNLGVDSAWLKQQLEMGLAKAGLSNKMNAQQLLVDLGSADYKRASDAAQALQTAWQVSQQQGGPEYLQQLGRNLAGAGVTPIPGRSRAQ